MHIVSFLVALCFTVLFCCTIPYLDIDKICFRVLPVIILAFDAQHPPHSFVSATRNSVITCTCAFELLGAFSHIVPHQVLGRDEQLAGVSQTTCSQVQPAVVRGFECACLHGQRRQLQPS